MDIPNGYRLLNKNDLKNGNVIYNDELKSYVVFETHFSSLYELFDNEVNERYSLSEDYLTSEYLVKDENVAKSDNGLYCSCISPVLKKNTAMGNSFNVCLTCKKEML